MFEIWKSVTGFEGSYQVSNLGRVRSIKRMITYSDGRIRKYPQKILRPAINKKTGYLHVAVKTESRYVHILVAKAFIPNPKNKREVNHKNRNKSDNRVTNLEWVTSQDNKKHAVKNGVLFNPNPRKGSGAGSSKLTESDVIQIRKMSGEGKNNAEISIIFKVTKENIWFIVNRKTWTHI